MKIYCKHCGIHIKYGICPNDTHKTLWGAVNSDDEIPGGLHFCEESPGTPWTRYHEPENEFETIMRHETGMMPP